MVLEPESAGVNEQELESIYHAINERVRPVLGDCDPLKETYHYLTTKAGELTMDKAKLSKNHKDLINYFASMMLDPDGHKKWMDEIRK